MENNNLSQAETINNLLVDMIQSQKESNKNLARAFIITIACFTVLIATMIVGFFVYESQYDVVDTNYKYECEQEAEAGDDGVAIVNGNGEINYAESEEQHESDGQDKDKDERGK